MHKSILFIQMTFLYYITVHVVFRNHVYPKNAEFPSNQVLSESSINEKVNICSFYTSIFQTILIQDFGREVADVSCSLFFQTIQRPHSNSGPPCLEELVAKKEKVIEPIADQFVNYIISSTPELRQFHGCVDAR